MRKASGPAIMFPARIATKMSMIAIDGMYLIKENYVQKKEIFEMVYFRKTTNERMVWKKEKTKAENKGKIANTRKQIQKKLVIMGK